MTTQTRLEWAMEMTESLRRRHCRRCGSTMHEPVIDLDGRVTVYCHYARGIVDLCRVNVPKRFEEKT